MSLSFAFPGSTYRQNPKHFRNYLINVRKARESAPPKAPNEARYGYYVNHEKVTKVKETFKEWFETVVKFTLPSSSKPLSIEYVTNVYRGISAKNCSRDKRGQSETQAHLQSLAIFHNIKNKEHL